MFAAIAVVLFVLAFIINAAEVSASAVFSPLSFVIAGLAFLAAHQTGAGPAWSMPRWRR
ncbi:MAG TPA: hypothetical protein VFQ44_00875 [Streptosporangiaceae bacterium]|nr:hypothetical protein [Streptosporangiaceae bacterium]